MPIYEFVCPKDHKFTKRLPMSESDSTQTCPECQGQATRIFSMPRMLHISIQFPDSTSRKFLSGSDTFRPEGPKEWKRGTGRKGKR